MVHGINDRRVPISRARSFRDALETDGFEEGHGSTDIEQKIRSSELVVDFLERRVSTE